MLEQLRDKRVILPVLALAAGATACSGSKASTVKPSEASGTVECPAGKPVVGIWIQAQVNRDRGFADWKAEPNQPNKATYSYTLTELQSYAVRVGCGGTPQNWLDNRGQPDYFKGTVQSGTPHDFKCHPSTDAADIKVGHGVCELVEK